LSADSVGGTGARRQKWVALARILRARGNKGEVAVELLTDFPQRLKELKEVYLGDGASDGVRGGEPRRVGVREFWVDRNHAGQAVYWFEACASINEAEKLRGLDVLIPFEQRIVLPDGQYFVEDLVGCSVFEVQGASAGDGSAVASSPCLMNEAPSLIGTVIDVQTVGEAQAGTPILVVDVRGEELLVPLAEDICRRIDVVGQRIEVVLPEGLRDLNSSSQSPDVD
jgi:16S rRNA processing protein RimM